MGFFSKIVGGVSKKMGANKNDVKLAEIELKKQKMEAKEADKKKKEKQKESKERAFMESVKGTVSYCYNNVGRIKDYLKEVEAETKRQVELIESSKERRLSKDEKIESSKAKENLTYLYLSQDFFAYCMKVMEGITLKRNEYKFITEFSHYFDGVKVLKDALEEKTFKGRIKHLFAERSLADELKDEAKTVLGNEIIFSFDYFFERHEKEIKEYRIPSLDPIIESFASSDISDLIDEEEEAELVESQPEIAQEQEPVEPEPFTLTEVKETTHTCPNCGASIDVNSKFCSNCGNKIEIPQKKKFCSECGAQLDPGAKFCSECGHKTN